MKYSLLFLTCFCCSTMTRSQHANVMISNANAPEEPSIIMNTKNQRYMVAGANIQSSYYSSDSGRSWNNLQSGTYLYRITISGKIYTQKIIRLE